LTRRPRSSISTGTVGEPPIEALEARSPWCRVCCTAHGRDQSCPGELRATGPERYGWRVQVETPFGFETYGTLVAPVADAWRARILTYPNVLWIIPRGGSLKFVRPDPGEVEQQAIDFVKLHCQLRGYRISSELPPIDGKPFDLEQTADAADSPDVQALQRQPHAFAVRFGAGRPTIDGTTGDLSESGVFIHTTSPLAPGTEVQIHLDAGGFGIPLRGIVQWTRGTGELGRPPGMGVKLVQPHARYLHLVRQIGAAETAVEVRR
jgi:hypothetical protein